MYVCMYVCMYACMYVCIICMYVCTYVCMYVKVYVCMHVYMYVCMSVCMYIYFYMYICMCIHTHSHSYTYIYIYIYIYIYRVQHQGPRGCHRAWECRQEFSMRKVLFFPLCKTKEKRKLCQGMGLPARALSSEKSSCMYMAVAFSIYAFSIYACSLQLLLAFIEYLYQGSLTLENLSQGREFVSG